MKLAFIIVFPLSIICVFVYLVTYDQISQDQIRQELTPKQLETIELLGDLDPTSSTIQKFRSDEELMVITKTLFLNQCASCHGILGSGQSAPNLCDDYFIHVKELPDLYTAISDGAINKGMIPFHSLLTNNQMILLSAYVANLRGSVSTGKFSEGQQIPPWQE